MTNKQLFTRMVKKAVKGGWQGIKEIKDVSMSLYDRDEIKITYIAHYGGYCFGNYNIYQLIFSYSFAKAFWIECNHRWCDSSNENGLFEKCNKCNMEVKMGERPKLHQWQYHLQQMVLKKEPLKYIERFL